MSIAMLTPEPDEARRTRILLAAERAFARHGFHGATMQAVAAEAGMSAGNLYRTFPSKEALVQGLAARDRTALAGDFARLAGAPDLLASMAALLRERLVDAPAADSQLALEIWAESGRNPDVARICRETEAVVRERLLSLVGPPARAAGVAPAFAVDAVLTVTAGLFKRRATEPDFDGGAAVALALGLFRALFAGAVRPCALPGAGA